ncbi:MAG: lipid A deacylase LpxR family protein [Gemmatimonadetes bacterium]|nr:lipid A deacylase LpxR family protein [Gemmatimonadota bacterium]
MRRVQASLAVLLLCASAAPARAQQAITARADNDAFNFWQLPWVRPDEEYTSGVRLTVTLDGAPRWARPFRWALGACAQDAARCASREYAVGQDIYTAVRRRGSANAVPGGRPDAAVLWVSARSRVARGRSVRELSWTVGVTGKPSLAEAMQQVFHDLAPRMNRPITWGPELPAELVIGVAHDRSRAVDVGALEVRPHVGVSLGTLLTEARAGVAMSRQLVIPMGAIGRRFGAVTAEVVADAQGRAVARNVVLSGTYFRDSPRVALRPLVGQYTAGLRLGWRMLEASWLANQTGAEHRGRTRAHRWSTLELRWRPAR